METVIVRGLQIGAGMPKICVPILGKTDDEIQKAARKVCNLPTDLAEWRVDWYQGYKDTRKVLSVLDSLREILGAMPLLVTFRSKQEGGEKELSEKAYGKLLLEIAQSGYADLLDVEMYAKENARQLVEEIHQLGCKVIGSCHIFSETPTKGDMLSLLHCMQEEQADIVKLAVMPKDARDVMNLLVATEEMNRLYANVPVVTMSMGKLGMVSRVCGELIGSAITFGAGDVASAPGQVPAKQLREELIWYHENLC